MYIHECACQVLLSNGTKLLETSKPCTFRTKLGQRNKIEFDFGYKIRHRANFNLICVQFTHNHSRLK